VAPRPPRAAADTPFSAGDSELLPQSAFSEKVGHYERKF